MKKGFTLVEMMAVIAVLGLLVLLVLPNVLKNYKDAKKISFINEAKTIYKASTDKYVTERTKGNKIGLIEQEKDSSTNPLSLAEASDLNYTIRLDSDGRVTAFKLSNAEFCIVGVGDFLGNYSKEDVIELSDEEAAQACEVTAVQNHQKFILRLQNKGTIKADYNPKIIYLKYNDGWFKDNNLHNEISEVIIPYRENNYYEGAWATNTLGSEIQAINCDGKISQDETGGGIFTGKEAKPYVEAFSRFIKKYYQVVFVGGDGSTGSIATIKCEYGKRDCAVPSNIDANGYGKTIKKTGHLFKGWTSVLGDFSPTQLALPEINDANEDTYPSIKFDNDKVCSGDQNIENKVTFNAVWEAIKYQIAYNCNGGTGTMANTNHTYDIDANLRNNTCVRTGYSFLGWSKTPTGSKEFDNGASVKNLTVQNDAVVTLYAVWQACGPGKYLAGNTCTACQQNYYSTETANASCTKCPDGYTTIGTGSSSKAACTINCEANYRVATVDKKCTSKCSDGYNHDAHKVKAGEVSSACSANKYTVAYNGNGHTGGKTDSTSHEFDKATNLRANGYTKTGYLFAGWAESASGSVKYADKASVSNLTKINNGTVTLYAKWTPITYTVAYNGNGYTGGKTDNTAHTYDKSANLRANGYTKTGYLFAGWAESASGSVKYADKASVKNLTTTNNGTVTLYAKWTPITFTIAYNGNGYTSGSTSSHTCTYDQACLLSANGFAKTNHSFDGWKKDNTGNALAVGTSVKNITSTNGATITYYVNWKQNYTASFTYTGDFKYKDGDGEVQYGSNGPININSANWYIWLLTSGTLTSNITTNVNSFLVAGGEKGNDWSGHGGAGGGHAYVDTTLYKDNSYYITIGGSNENTYAFDSTAYTGYGSERGYAAKRAPNSECKNYAAIWDPTWGKDGVYAWDDSSIDGIQYGAGGGGGGYCCELICKGGTPGGQSGGGSGENYPYGTGTPGTPNTGGGGGGGNNLVGYNCDGLGKLGGSGVVIIRNLR